LLADLPTEITVGCNRPHELARRLAEQELTDALRISHDEVVFTTKHPTHLLARLPAWVADGSIEIAEVKSGDESLQSLFSSLLRIHRGEL
jgi:ABC-2 type transport system ATP-binding protein